MAKLHEESTREFEREVASIYDALGARVKREVAIAGERVDIVVSENEVNGPEIVTIIECKAYQNPVGIDVVNAFTGLFHLLKQRKEADRAILVAKNGFTRAARDAALADSVQLIDISDLRQRVRGKQKALGIAKRRIRRADDHQSKETRAPQIFVAMPFSREFNDVYLLGVRDVAERVGYVVERADEIEHNGYIVGVITERLRECDVLVADTTTRNPNVLYEVGYAHALGLPTVLICREGEEIPFDIKSVNHIVYGSIVDLREKLTRRLGAMLDGRDPR